MSSLIKVNLTFSGGVELLFNNIKQKIIEIPSTINPPKPTTMKDLILWIKDNLLQERSELFVSGNTVRPGILVLINDTDWELEGELEYEIKDNDEINTVDASNGSMLQGPFSEGFRSLNENSNDAQWLPVIPDRLKLELIKLLEIYYNM
ncbi:26726_t:CDS:2, partial [Gigaspora margarita]